MSEVSECFRESSSTNPSLSHNKNRNKMRDNMEQGYIYPGEKEGLIRSSHAAAAPASNRSFVFKAVAVVTLVALCGVVLTSNQFTKSASTSTTLETTSSLYNKFTFGRKGYSNYPYFDVGKSDIVKYTSLTNYDAIIEPYADMELRALGTVRSDEFLKFKVCAKGDSNSCYEGTYTAGDESKQTSINIDCSAGSDEFTISIAEVDTSGTITKEITGTALCMYVRREIRDLSEDDLNSVMDAMYTLWSTDEDTGQALYGESYHSASYFSAAHDFNAAQQDADHIHEGLGFLPQHMKLTNMFEEAMQAVDPAVALPYWDFTIDVAENKTIFESFIFTEDTFGSITKPSSSYWGFQYAEDSLDNTKILDGRWKDTKAEDNSRFPELGNGFGYMRGPWNMNPSPYVTRFSSYSPSLPSCSDYYGGIGMTGFVDFLATAPYGSHASTHGVIGSVFGCDKMSSMRSTGIIEDDESQLSLCKSWGFYMKELYRGNYITSSDDCSVTSLDEEGISCSFECNASQLDDMIDALKFTLPSQYMKKGMSTDDWITWRDFVCDGDGWRIFVGDHLESASPSDPSFWPIHPTQERLMQVKFMTGSFGSTKVWPSDAINDYVCDKASCYSAAENRADYYDDCCYGHYEYDQLLDFTTGDRSNYVGPTNHKIVSDSDPTSMMYSMTYIYDDFDWDHCEEDFDALIENGGKISGLTGPDSGANFQSNGKQ